MGNVQMHNVSLKDSQLPHLENVKSFLENLPHRIKRKLHNPGSYGDIDEKWKSLQPECFDGFRVIINQDINPNVKMMHTLHLNAYERSNYQFKAKVTPNDETPIIWCEMDQMGMLKGNILHQVNERIRLKANTRLDPQFIEVPQMNGEYAGDDFTATLMLSNISLSRKTASFTAQYLQAITKQIALGTQLTYQLQRHATWDSAGLTLIGRFIMDDIIWTGSVRRNVAQVRFYRDVASYFKLGMQLTTNLTSKNMACKVNCEVNLQEYGTVLRGVFDSYWNAGGVIEKRLQNYPLMFLVSCGYNYINNEVKVGAAFSAY